MSGTTTRQTKGNTLELLRQYQVNPSYEVRNHLVNLNIGLVRREAYHWLQQSNETFEDLMQVGSLGLIRAIERFDLSKGYAFSSFAIPYIRGEIQHYLRDKSTSMRIPSPLASPPGSVGAGDSAATGRIGGGCPKTLKLPPPLKFLKKNGKTSNWPSATAPCSALMRPCRMKTALRHLCWSCCPIQNIEVFNWLKKTAFACSRPCISSKAVPVRY